MNRIRRLAALLRASGRYLFSGLAVMGQSSTVAWMPAPGPAEHDEPKSLPRAGLTPLPGHPERLVPDLAPTPVEVALWAQLGH